MINLPATAALSEAEYEAIESAVAETARGRWFLTEYARRNRNADTATLMTALDRIEAVIRGERTVEAVDRIRFDLVDMAKAIARTKTEIAAIKPDTEHHGKIGVATEELDSIVATTESATSEILAAAEYIQEAAWTLREHGHEEEICDLIDARATEIYTACSFQDLTGQRTRKVIQVLRYLEGRINAMIDIWGLDAAMAKTETPQGPSERSLINGPARPGEGLDQSDVDMVMGPAQVRAAHQDPQPIIEIQAQSEAIGEAALAVAPPTDAALLSSDLDLAAEAQPVPAAAPAPEIHEALIHEAPIQQAPVQDTLGPEERSLLPLAGTDPAPREHRAAPAASKSAAPVSGAPTADARQPLASAADGPLSEDAAAPPAVRETPIAEPDLSALAALATLAAAAGASLPAAASRQEPLELIMAMSVEERLALFS